MAFDEGRFAEAAALLERAYALAPSSSLLYNLGRAHQQAGNKRRAIDAYRKYLAAETSPPDEGLVRRSIKQLEDELDQEAALIFAELLDYLRDYRDTVELHTEVDKLNVFADIQDYIDKLNALRISVRFAVRDSKLVNSGWIDKTPWPVKLVYLTAANKEDATRKMAVPKRVHLG